LVRRGSCGNLGGFQANSNGRGKAMLKKTPYRGGKSCRVTFVLPKEVGAARAFVVGEFNEWDETANPLRKRKEGHLSASLTLKTGRAYRFRYLLDGRRWENDPQADDFAANPFGSEDSVLRL